MKKKNDVADKNAHNLNDTSVGNSTEYSDHWVPNEDEESSDEDVDENAKDFVSMCSA